MRTEKRLPYKQSKTRNYWPTDNPAGRRTKLFRTWRAIVTALDDELSGISDYLQFPALGAPSWQLKAFEDMLDAVICAWVGICVLEGTSVPFGDDTSAIWIPQSALLSSRRSRP
ncbi:DUF429 domain-containing protein [Shinella sp.]|uniref:DUF429 domain-containing protein n=1 Tax=Shinella sp. TaxID=1870904 RepID=UPI003F72B58F